MLRRALAGTLDDSEMERLVSAFDQVGDIIVIRIPPSLYEKRRQIGLALLDNIKVASRVFCQRTDVGGEYRTRELELVAGRGDTQTEYRENGCSYVVDVEKVFFTPRLSTERARVASLARPREMILNMFAGAGMYSVQMARSVPCTIYDIDVNPHATWLSVHNARRNKIAGSIISVTDDAERFCGTMPDSFDRIVMSLPERAEQFLEAAVLAAANGATIHYYAHIHADRKQEAVRALAERFAEISPAAHRITAGRLVRAVGPRYYQVAVDVEISKG